MLAAELGGDPRVAARAALLHDIGKAVSHEAEGPHALVGGELARRYKESEGVAHAMEAHHNEVEPQTVEAVIVQIVDALSGARPGARGESLEHYVKRLHELEAIACRHPGVDKVYAMHAGREIRVIVHPEEIDDDARDAALAPDRPRGREGARVPRPDQGHRDPREPGHRLREVDGAPARLARPRGVAWPRAPSSVEGDRLTAHGRSSARERLPARLPAENRRRIRD